MIARPDCRDRDKIETKSSVFISRPAETRSLAFRSKWKQNSGLETERKRLVSRPNVEIKTKTEIETRILVSRLVWSGDFSGSGPSTAGCRDEATRPGAALSREEMVRIWLALRSLVESHPVERVRFWGKILGTERHYVVAEVQWREGEGDDDEMEVVVVTFFNKTSTTGKATIWQLDI